MYVYLNIYDYVHTKLGAIMKILLVSPTHQLSVVSNMHLTILDTKTQKGLIYWLILVQNKQ